MWHLQSAVKLGQHAGDHRSEKARNHVRDSSLKGAIRLLTCWRGCGGAGLVCAEGGSPIF
jgi:hypothetical protein